MASSTFISGGKSIRIDRYLPSGTGAHPAVILIHGSGGPLRGADPIAQQACKLGINVFVPHYFERTGHDWVYNQQIESNFLAWLQTLREAILPHNRHVNDLQMETKLNSEQKKTRVSAHRFSENTRGYR